MHKTEIDSQTQENKKNLMVTKGERGVGISQAFGTNRYTLLYIKYISNKTLLYSTGNYSQYLILTCNGKEFEKKKIYIYITESLCCTPEINTAL